MELRCFGCICAGCPDEHTCTSNPCNGDEKRNPFECTDVMWECPLKPPDDEECDQL